MWIMLSTIDPRRHMSVQELVYKISIVYWFRFQVYGRQQRILHSSRLVRG